MGTDEPHLDNHDEGIATDGAGEFSRFTRRASAAIAIAAVVIVALIVFWQLISVLLVIFLAVLLAVFLRGLTNYVAEHTPLSSGWSLFAVSIGLLGACTAVVWLLAPSVIDQFNQITETLPEAFAALRDWIERSSIGGRLLPHIPRWSELDAGSSFSWSGLTGAFSSVFGVVTNLFFVFFVGVYLAIDPALYKRGMVRLIPLRQRDRAEHILDTLSHQLGWWLVGRLLSMLVVAVLTTAGLWAMGMPLPLVLGLIAGLVSFVPIVGPIVSFAPAALLALLKGPEWIFYTALLYLGVQTIESYLLTPQIQKRTVSVPPALILISQLVAGALFGIVGIIVATPITVVVMALVNMIYVEDVLGDQTRYSEKAPGDG